MSLDATRWAWMQPVKPASLKLLLLSLADRANGVDFQCYPSIERLCIDTGLDRKTVMRGLKQLAEIGLIERTVRPSVGNIYQLIGVQDRQSTEEVFNFIYRTEDVETGEFYIGVHTTTDMSDRYLGSGRWVTSHPDKRRLQRVVVQQFGTRSEALRAEIEIVEQLISDPLCRNVRAERGNLQQADAVERKVNKAPKTAQSPKNGTKSQKRDSLSTENGTYKSQKRDSLSTENGTQTYQEPISEPTNKPVLARRQGKASVSTFVLPENVDAEAWQDFEQYRSESKTPLTDSARKHNAAFLAKFGADEQREIVAASIRSGWLGLFEPKGRAKPTKPQAPIASEDFASKTYTSTDTSNIDWLSQ